MVAEAGLVLAAMAWTYLGWRWPQCYTLSVVGKDSIPQHITLLSSENASFLMCTWLLTSPSVPLYQPVGGAALCKLGQRALKRRCQAPSIYLHNWWYPSNSLQPQAHQENMLTQKEAVKCLRNSSFIDIFYSWLICTLWSLSVCLSNEAKVFPLGVY